MNKSKDFKLIIKLLGLLGMFVATIQLLKENINDCLAQTEIEDIKMSLRDMKRMIGEYL